MINLIDWTRNVAKSTVYSTAEVLSDNFSVAKEFKNTNSELFKETYSSIKNYRTTFKRIKNAIEKNDIYVAANVAAKNIIEDIKTGNFYNVAREEEINEKYGGLSFNDEEWDIDSNEFDWEDKNISDGEKIIAGAIKKNSKINSIVLSDTIAKTTNATIDASRENTTLLYLQNERLLGNINKSFDSFRDFAQRNVERDIKLQNNRDKKFDKFFSKIEENTNKIVAELDELVKLQRNTVLGPEGKTRPNKITALDIINDGAIDLKAYGKNIANNLFERIDESLGGGLSTISNISTGEGSNMLAAMAANPTKEIVQEMIKSIIPKEYKQITNEFNESMSGWASTIISRFNDMAKNGDREIDRLLGSILGIKTKKAPTSIDTSKYRKGPISFDGITKKSITEVIPYYLRKMTSVITGEEEKVFDFETGKWTTLRKVKDDQKNALLNKYMQGTSNIESIIKESTGDYQRMYRNKTQQKKFDKDMEKFRIAVYNNGGNIGEVLNNPFMYGIDEEHAKFLKKVFKSYRDQYYTSTRTINGKRGPRTIINGIDRTKGANGVKTGRDITSLLFGLSGNIMRKEQEQILKMKKLEENADAVQRILYSEGIKINAKSGYQITNEYGDLDQKQAFNSPLVKAMMIMKDEYNYTLFDYLRGIKKDLSAIRSNGVNIFGNVDNDSNNSDNLMSFENTTDYYSNNHIYDNFTSSVNYRLGNYHEKEKKKSDEKEKAYYASNQNRRELNAKERQKGYRPFAADDSSQLGRYFQSYQTYITHINEKYQRIEDEELANVYKQLVDLDLINDAEAKRFNSIKYDPEIPFKEQMDKLTSTGERLALIRSYAVNVSEKPFHAVDDALISLNDWMTQIFFGDQLDKNNDKENDNNEDSIFSIIKNRFKRGFEDIGKIVSDKLTEIIDGPFKKMREKVLIPFKEFLIGHREKSTDPFSGGLFGDLIESIRTSWDEHTKYDLARWAAEDKAKLKAAMGKDRDDEYDDNTTYSNINNNATIQYRSVLTDEEKDLLSKIKNIRTDRIEKIVDKDIIIGESSEYGNERSRFVFDPDTDSEVNGYISQFNGHIDNGILNVPVSQSGEKYEIPALIWKEFKANPSMLELLGAKISNGKISNIKIVGNNFYNYLTWCTATGYTALQSLNPNNIRQYMNSEFKKWIDSTKGNKYKISNADIILFKQLSAQQGRLAQETAQRRNAIQNPDVELSESVLNEIYRKNSNTVKIKSSDSEEKNNKTIKGIMTRDPKCRELIERYEIDIDEYIKWCNNNPNMDFYTKLDPVTLLAYGSQMSYEKNQNSKISGDSTLSTIYTNRSNIIRRLSSGSLTNDEIESLKSQLSIIDRNIPNENKNIKKQRLESTIDKIINNSELSDEEKRIKIDNIKRYYSKQYGEILEEYEKDFEDKQSSRNVEEPNRNINIFNRILNPLQEISDNIKKIVSYFDNGFRPATNTPETPPLFARGGINLTGKPFKSVVSSGEIINGNIVPAGGPYITTIPENGVVINPADESTINKQSIQETNFLNKLRHNSEANDGLRPIFNSITDFNKKHSESIGDAIVRGGLGFGAGFLLGNPFLGAIIGSISSLANKTNEAASVLFGDAIVNEEGKVIDRKDNGLISNEILKAAPDMRLGGLLGTIGGLFTPFGPVGGLLIGSALGFAKKNELIQDSLFGKDGIIDKDKLENALPSMGIGAATGSLLLAGMGSPLGLIGNALVGSAIGFATTTDSFKEIVLGEEDSDGKRHGGIVGILKTAMNPLKNFANTMIEGTMTAIFGKKVKEGEDGPETRKGGLFGAFKDMVIKPAAESVAPIVQEIKNTVNKTFNFVDQLFDKIGFNKQHFIDRVGGLFNSLGQIAITTAKLGLLVKGTPLMLGAQAIKQTGLHFRRKQIRRGEAYDMTAQDRLDDRDKHNIAYKLGSGFETLRNSIINIGREANGKETLTGNLSDRYLRNDKTLASMATNMSVDELEQIAGALRYDSTNSDDENIITQEKQYRTAFDDEATSITKGLKNGHKFVSRINSLVFSGRGNEAIELINMNSDLSDDQKNKLIIQVNKYMNHSKSVRANYSISKNMQKDLSDRLKKLGLDVDLTDKKDRLKLAKNIQTEIISKSKGLSADQLEKMREWRDEANPAVQQVKILKEIFKVLSGKNVDTVNDEEENIEEKNLRERYSKKAKDIITRSENGEKLSKFEEEELNNAKRRARKIINKMGITNSELSEDELLKKYIEEEIVNNRMSRVENSRTGRKELSEVQKAYRAKQKKLEEMSGRKSDRDYIDYGISKTNDELDKNNEQIDDNEYIERAKEFARRKKVKDNEEYSDMIEENNSNGILSRLQNDNEQNFFKRIATSTGTKISKFFKFSKKKNKKNREFVSDIDNDSTKYTIKLSSKEKEIISSSLAEKGNNESEIKKYLRDITSRELTKNELKEIKSKFNINPKIRNVSVMDIAKNAKTNDKLTEYNDEIDDITIESDDDEDDNTSILGKIGRKNKKKSKSNNIILGAIKNISKVIIKPISNLVEITETIKDKIEDVKDKSQGVKYWISKIFGISKFIVGVPLLVSFLNSHIIPFVKDKLTPILVGTKDSDGNYQNGILSNVINPIKNKFGEKIDTIKNWVTNKGEYEDNTKGLKGLMTNIFSSWKDGVGIIVDSIIERVMPKLEDIGAKIGIGIAKAWTTGWKNVGASMADRDMQYDKYRNAVDPNQIKNYMINEGKDPNSITQQDLNEYYSRLGYNPEDVNKYTESHNINPTNFAFSTNAKANDKLTPFNRAKKSDKNDLINWVFQSTSVIDDLYTSDKINQFKKLYQTNNSINNKIDDGTITPIDKEYWNIRVNDNGDPLINSLYKMKESFNRLVKSPFSLVASSIGDVVGTVSTNSGDNNQSNNNYSNSSLGQTSTISSSSNSSSKISTSASSTSASQTKKTSNLFSKIGNGIKNIAKKIFGKGKYGRGYGDHIYQREYSGSYQTSGDTERQTIADSGCGPAAAAAVLNQYGMNGNMNNAVNYALKGGFKEINGGTYPDYFDSYLNNNGIQTQTVYNNNDVVNSLINGKPVIMMGQDEANSGDTPYGSDYSHYVVATGLDNNGNVIVEDSEDPNGSTVYDLNKTLNNTSVKITTGMGRGKSNTKYGRAKQTIMDRFIGNVTNAIYTPYLMYSATLQNAMNNTYTSNNSMNTNISRNSGISSNNTSSTSTSSSSNQTYKGSGAIGNGGGNNTEANRKAVWRWFRSKGFTKEATAGIIGNMERETRIHTNEQSKSYNAAGSVTNGIIQWDPFSKHENFCKKNNISDPFDLEGQLMHVLYSIQNEWLDNGTRYDYSKYKYVSSEEFPHLTSVELAAIAFERGVEGCSGYFGKWGIPFAQKTYNMLAASDGAEDSETSGTGRGIVNHIRNAYGRGGAIPKDDISYSSSSVSSNNSGNNKSSTETNKSTSSSKTTTNTSVSQVTSEGKAEVTFGGLSDLLKGYMSALFPGTFSSNNNSSSTSTTSSSSTSGATASTNGTNGKLNPDSDVKTTCGYTATQLKNAIRAIHPEGCSAEQFPEAAIAVEKSKGVNALFTIAVGILEHGWNGVVGINTTHGNYGNWNVFNIQGQPNSSNGRWKDYNSLTDAFEGFANLIMGSGYYGAGLTTPAKIGNRYCPPTAAENASYGPWGEAVCRVANTIADRVSTSGRGNINRKSIYGRANENTKEQKKKTTTSIDPNTGIISKLANYAGNAMKKTYGAYYYTIFGDEGVYSNKQNTNTNNNTNNNLYVTRSNKSTSTSSKSSNTNMNKNNVINTAMKVFYKTGPTIYGSYTTIELDGDTYKVRCDCSGYVSTIIKAMGYKLTYANGSSADMLNSSAYGTAGCSKYIKNRDGSDTNDWEDIPFSVSALRPGDIIAHPGHVEIYWFTNSSGRIRGFSAGATEGILSSYNSSKNYIENKNIDNGTFLYTNHTRILRYKYNNGIPTPSGNGRGKGIINKLKNKFSIFGKSNESTTEQKKTSTTTDTKKKSSTTLGNDTSLMTKLGEYIGNSVKKTYGAYYYTLFGDESSSASQTSNSSDNNQNSPSSSVNNSSNGDAKSYNPNATILAPFDGYFWISSMYDPTGAWSRTRGGAHGGVDIIACTEKGVRRTNAPIYSLCSGTVVHAGWENANNHSQGFGQYVSVQDSNGDKWYYGHMSSVTVSTGQQVSVGTQLGCMGTTGSSTGDHTHFEIRPSSGGTKDVAAFMNIPQKFDAFNTYNASSEVLAKGYPYVFYSDVFKSGNNSSSTGTGKGKNKHLVNIKSEYGRAYNKYNRSIKSNPSSLEKMREYSIDSRRIKTNKQIAEDIRRFNNNPNNNSFRTTTDIDKYGVNAVSPAEMEVIRNSKKSNGRGKDNNNLTNTLLTNLINIVNTIANNANKTDQILQLLTAIVANTAIKENKNDKQNQQLLQMINSINSSTNSAPISSMEQFINNNGKSLSDAIYTIARG